MKAKRTFVFPVFMLLILLLCGCGTTAGKLDRLSQACKNVANADAVRIHVTITDTQNGSSVSESQEFAVLKESQKASLFFEESNKLLYFSDGNIISGNRIGRAMGWAEFESEYLSTSIYNGLNKLDAKDCKIETKKKENNKTEYTIEVCGDSALNQLAALTDRFSAYNIKSITMTMKVSVDAKLKIWTSQYFDMQMTMEYWGYGDFDERYEFSAELKEIGNEVKIDIPAATY